MKRIVVVALVVAVSQIVLSFAAWSVADSPLAPRWLSFVGNVGWAILSFPFSGSLGVGDSLELRVVANGLVWGGGGGVLVGLFLKWSKDG